MEWHKDRVSGEEVETGISTSDMNSGSAESGSVPSPRMRLGDILVELGFVERVVVEGAATVQQRGVGKRIGELLVERGHLTRWQLERALQIQSGDIHKRLGDILVEQGGITREVAEGAAQKGGGRPNSRLGKLLLEEGVITESHLARALARRHGLPFARLGRLLEAPDSFSLAMLPWELMSRLRAIPVEKEGGRLLVVLDDPSETGRLAELEKAAGCPIDLVVSTPTEILYVLKNYSAQKARMVAEQAIARERLVAENTDDETSLEKLRAAEKETEEAELAARMAELEEELAAQKLATERVEEEREILEISFAEEKAAIEGRFAAELKALEEKLAEATETTELASLERAKLEEDFAQTRETLERQLVALTDRLDEEKKAAERFVIERLNHERGALEARFAVQLNAAEETLNAERRMFKEQLATEQALKERAISEKADLEMKLAEALDTMIATHPAEPIIKQASEKSRSGIWWQRGAAAAAVVALLVSVYFNVPRKSVQKNAVPIPVATVAMAPMATEKPSLPSVLPKKSAAGSGGARLKTSAHRSKRLVKWKQTKHPAFASTEKGRKALRTLEDRMSTDKIVLARLEARLVSLVQELESMKAGLAGDLVAIEDIVRKLKAGATVDFLKYQLMADEYNDEVKHFNSLLAEADRAAEEYDNMLLQNRQIAEVYQSLSTGR